jgi:hypothetical protein
VRASAALLLAGCVHVEMVKVGAHSLERTQWERDLDTLQGLAVPIIRCPRAEQQIEVLDVESTWATHVRVVGCEKIAFFELCRRLMGSMWVAMWLPSGTDCPPPEGMHFP